MNKVSEDFLTLYCDPGEDFGWAIGKDVNLLAAGTEKMWPFADHVWEKMQHPEGAQKERFYSDGFAMVESNPLCTDTHVRDGVDPELMKLPIARVVCEDFKLYPWELSNMAWDPVRTARVIGAITFMCRQLGIALHFQGANIKDAAKAAGAEELYYRPLHENRHQNDAIQHFVFFSNVELMGLPLPVPAGNSQEDFS